MARYDPLTTAFLLVEQDRSGPPVWAVKWRASDGRRIKRRLGAKAWMAFDRGEWHARRGRPAPEHLTERQASRLIPEVVRGAEEAAADKRAQSERDAAAAERAQQPTFRELTAAWLAHLEAVDDAKPSTLRTYRFMLAEAGRPHRRGAGTARGRIMAALGDKPPAEITTADVVAMLDTIAADGVSRTTVNRHREIVVAILNFGLRPENRRRWRLTENSAAAAP